MKQIKTIENRKRSLAQDMNIDKLGKNFARIDRSYDESRLRQQDDQIAKDEYVIQEVDDMNENTHREAADYNQIDDAILNDSFPSPSGKEQFR